MLTCNNTGCGNMIDEQSGQHYTGYNHQKGYEPVVFCSKECLKSWIKSKLTGMIVSIVLGVILAIMIPDLWWICLLAPYMIRQCGSLLGELFDGGSVGEFLAIAIALIGIITVIYPLYKLMRETSYYVLTLKELA